MLKEKIIKYRVPINTCFFILALILSDFEVKKYFTGLTIAMIGEMIRLWSSGYIKKDKELAVKGPYHLVRNPLYLGSFLIAVGIGIGWNVLPFLFVYLPVFIFVHYLTVKKEEDFLAEFFGEKFEVYKRKTPSIFPFKKIDLKQISLKEFSFAQLIKNGEHKTAIALLIGFLLVPVKNYFLP